MKFKVQVKKLFFQTESKTSNLEVICRVTSQDYVSYSIIHSAVEGLLLDADGILCPVTEVIGGVSQWPMHGNGGDRLQIR